MDRRLVVVGRVGLLGVVLLGLGLLMGQDASARSGWVQARDDGAEAGAGAGEEQDRAAEEEKLTLDRIFPEKSFFGPSARSAAFCHEGRFLAYLYRPYAERRHGNDLYIRDTRTGETRRITGVGRMAEFRADAREVRDDRAEKAKKAGVTLSLLAREQAERMGWTDRALVGRWTGTASGEGGGLGAGEVVLELSERANGSFAGTLRVGFVRLGLRSVRLDERAGTVGAEIDESAVGVKGRLDLTLEGGTLGGELVLTEPAQTLSIGATRAARDEEDPDGPRGVLGAIGERLTLGDVVLDSDAEINDDKDGKPVAKRAPRYSGVSSFEWSPTAHEMLVVSGGDLYRLTIDTEEWDRGVARPEPVAEPAPATDEAPEEASGPSGEGSGDENADETGDGADGGSGEPGSGEAEKKDADAAPKAEPVVPYRGELTRLTRTREGVSDVQYLPDGSGYTYLRGGALLRVSFGDHRIVQLDPELKDGERMVGYRISPDMNRLVFLATRGESTGSRASRVTIVSYRDRFARAREVLRHMPDDPWPESYTSVYLYDLRGHDREDGKLERVFTRRVSGPRDVMQVPEWSPDSARIAFAAFDQASEQMTILEAGFVDEEVEQPTEASSVEEAEAGTGDEKDGGDDGSGDGAREGAGEGGSSADAGGEKEPDFEIENARAVYRFLHQGGPNTPRMVRPMYLADSRRMVFITEISGYRQLHLLDPRYEALSPVTSGPFEVYPFHLTKDHGALFVTTTEGDPAQEHVVRIDLETFERRRLTSAEGVYNDVAVRDDGSLVAALHADFGSPRELVLVRPDAEGGEAFARLTDSHPEEAHKLTRAAPEYFTYQNRHGQTIHGHMFKPADWSPEDRRPLLIYVYGGPLSANNNMITRGSFSSPSYFFARYMAQEHGYVTATIDPRGTSGFGAVFEKANFEQIGKPQTEDLVDGARWFVEHHGVDESRMALHGWSFGGFQTQMVMYTEPEVFAAGIAGAGPTEWHNYNSWYSTGTVGPNRPGRTDLDKYSLLPLAKNLEGKLLLVHGVEDSNVLYQDTVRVYRELLQAGKEVNVELFIDPTGGHGLGGDVKTIGRYRKYEDFLVRNLGKGDPVGAEEDNAGGEVPDDAGAGAADNPGPDAD